MIHSKVPHISHMSGKELRLSFWHCRQGSFFPSCLWSWSLECLLDKRTQRLICGISLLPCVRVLPFLQKPNQTNKTKQNPRTALLLFRESTRFARLWVKIFFLHSSQDIFKETLKSRKNLTGHWNSKYRFNKKAGREASWQAGLGGRVQFWNYFSSPRRIIPKKVDHPWKCTTFKCVTDEQISPSLEYSPHCLPPPPLISGTRYDTL